MEVKCYNCGIELQYHMHVFITTGNLDPIQEAYVSGDFDLLASFHLEATATAAIEFHSGYKNIPIGMPTGYDGYGLTGDGGINCIACIPFMVAGVGIQAGVFGRLRFWAEAKIEATVTLEYQKNAAQSGHVLMHHADGQELQNVVTGFDGFTETGDSSAAPAIQLNIEAELALKMKAELYVGLMTNLGVVKADAYAKVEAELSIHARFRFQTAWGTDNMISALDSTASCTAWREGTIDDQCADHRHLKDETHVCCAARAQGGGAHCNLTARGGWQ